MIRFIFVRLALFWAFLLPFTLQPAVASTVTYGVEAAIAGRIRTIEQAWDASDVDRVAKVYGKEARVSGEDQPMVSGRLAVTKLIANLMAENATVAITIHEFRMLGPTSALSWVVWHVQPKKHTEHLYLVKSLLVWTRNRGKWFIAADMFAMGDYQEEAR